MIKYKLLLNCSFLLTEKTYKLYLETIKITSMNLNLNSFKILSSIYDGLKNSSRLKRIQKIKL